MSNPLQPEGQPQERPSWLTGPRVLFWILVAASLLLVGGGIWQVVQDQRRWVAQAGPMPAVPQPAAANFSLTTTDGDTVRLADLRGKVVLLNFWATWCPPCKAEMPDLNTLHETYGAEQDFVVLAVNIEERPAVVSAFAQQYKLSFPLLLDTEGTVSSQTYSVRSLPTSIVIDRNGVVRDRWVGQLSKSAILAKLKQVW